MSLVLTYAWAQDSSKALTVDPAVNVYLVLFKAEEGEGGGGEKRHPTQLHRFQIELTL